MDPHDKPLVVVTRAHYDHIGNLAHFGRSRMVIARAELAFWTGPYGRQALFHYSVEDELGVLAAVADAGRGIIIDDQVQLADGVDVLRVDGYTPVSRSSSSGSVRDRSCWLPTPFITTKSATSGCPSRPWRISSRCTRHWTVTQMTADGTVAHVVSGHDPYSRPAYRERALAAPRSA